MRFVQGFALGGEATGAQLMTMEHAPKDRRAFYSALMSMGSPASQVMANLLLAVLSAVLADDAFFAWGWRLPFLLSLALVGGRHLHPPQGRGDAHLQGGREAPRAGELDPRDGHPRPLARPCCA